MSRLLGSKAKMFVAGLSFVGLLLTTTLAIPQIAQVEPAAALASLWMSGGPAVRFVDVSSSNDGLIAYATENPTNADKKIWKTVDGGLNWAELANAPETRWGSIATSGNGQIVVALATSGDDQIIYQSIDSGVTWSSVYNAAPSSPEVDVLLKDIAIADDGNTVVVASAAGVLKSITSGIFAPTAAPNLETPNQGWGTVDISAGGQTLVVASSGTEIYKSTDAGTSWEKLLSSEKRDWFQVGVSADGLTIMGVSKGDIDGVRYSRDGGTNFTSAGIGDGFIPGQTVYGALSDDGLVMIAASYNSTPKISFDGGQSWSFSQTGATSWMGFSINDSAVPSRRIIAVTENNNVRSYRTFPAPTLTSISPSSGVTGQTEATITGTGFADLISLSIGRKLIEQYQFISDNELRFVVPRGQTGTVDVVLTTVGGTATLVDGFTYELPSDTPNITWNSLGNATSNVYEPDFYSVVQSLDGSIYVAGNFEDLGGEPAADFVAKWDGTSWTGFGSSVSGNGLFECESYCAARDIAVAANGDVYVSVDFVTYNENLDAYFLVSKIARWDGATWRVIGQNDGGSSGLEFDSRGNLYAFGGFENLGGVATADHVAKWDGTSWSGLGSNGAGDGALNSEARTLAIGGDGSVYVSGEFSDVAGLADADSIARWNGSAWQALGPPIIEGALFSLDAYTMIVDSSSGTDVLYIGGCMYWKDEDVLSVAQWNGTNWAEVAGKTRLDSCVYDFAFAPTGGLVAAGKLNFTENPGISGSAVWNGSEWRSLGISDGDFYSVVVTPDSRLIVSGDFVDLNGNEDADYLAISNPLARLTPLGAAAVVAPNVGPDTGGTTVVLTGSHYSWATRVEFGSTPATSLKVLSDTSISVVTPAHSAGAVDVHLISDSGERVLAKGFTYIETVVSVMDTAEEVATLPEQTIVPNPDFVSGESQTFSVPGFVPGELVQVILASTPRLLTSAIADANGVATFTFTIPSDISGRHTLAVYAPVSGRGIRQIIEIAATRPVVAPANTLPKTGVAVEILWPMALLLSGMMLVSFSILRRRKIASEA